MEKYQEYLQYKEEFKKENGRELTITFDEWSKLHDYTFSMVAEEIQYMFESFLNGEEYNPPKGKTDFDERARLLTREVATNYFQSMKEEIEEEMKIRMGEI